MAQRNCVLAQTLIGGRFGSARISTEFLDASQLNAASLEIFDHARPIGISPGYSKHGRLAALAVADDQNCRIVMFRPTKHGSASRPDYSDILQDKVLCRSSGNIFAFDMGPLAMLLNSDLGIRVTNAIDIQSGFSAVDRKPLTAIRKLVGDSAPIMDENVEAVFREPIFDRDNRDHGVDLAMRAWVSQFLVTYENGLEIFDKVLKINTKDMAEEKLQIIAKLATDALRLDNMKPTEVTHSVTLSTDPASRATQLLSQSYDNRIRRNKDIRINAQNDSGSYRIDGSVGKIRGRRNLAETARSLQGATVFTVTSIGRDDPTTAEALRAATVLRILQGSTELLNDNPWIQNIWFPRDDGLLKWPDDWPRKLPVPSRFIAPKTQQLNASQEKAVNAMLSLSDNYRITLIQGPPGTGKTSVIAAFVQLSIALGRTGIWLVAQSNVAVKNIAEKLMKVDFFEWRLLVSHDFHFGWHEHLYSKVKKNLIRSDQFWFAHSRIKGASVILCTLNMLSHEKIKSMFMKMVPMGCLVVDEASQIEIGSYVTTFTEFGSTLRKVCFIGDNKQLPPYGQEDIEDLQSIFELPHLNKGEKLIFLDTQYRMPPQIGKFISKVVYEDKLESNPLHPIQDDIIACKFVDAGGNEYRSGDSYQNQAESDIVIKLAIKLQENNKSYRIITPYSGQRQLIEDKMKEIPDLHWGDKCFSVDSFQGNEDDYIVISLVRSVEVGFLKNLRRTNVMLTRCKRGMFIVSSQRFLKGPGANSLVGEMAEAMGSQAWIDVVEVEAEDFLL